MIEPSTTAERHKLGVSTMTTGTPFWVIQINSYKLEQQKMPKPEYFKLVKQLQFDLKHYAKDRLKFKTEEEASKVFNGLPKFIQNAAHVTEHTPVYGIF
jgi:hypothetical protein